MKPLLAILALAVLAGCTTTASDPPFVQPTSFSYSHVWGSQPPEPFYSQAVAMLDAGAVRIIRWPMWKVDRACGSNRDPSGWFQAACTVNGVSTGRDFIVIAEEITNPSVLRGLEIHEAAHVAGWPGDHPGLSFKPAGHLDRCIADMRAEGLTLMQMRGLCYLDGGDPLRTADERARWAAMQ